MNHHKIFDPTAIAGIALRNRIVMSPMTRSFSPEGVPGDDVVSYYQRRAEGEVGLIITEGTWIPHPSASNDERVPCFYGDRALAGWNKVARAVHAAGGRIIPQLWHCGLIENPAAGPTNPAPLVKNHQLGPSGMAGGAAKGPTALAGPMSQLEIDQVIAAYGIAARNAMEVGFDGIEIHGAHGYLIDQFLWDRTNLRDDDYGGDITKRTRFAADVVRECKRRTRPDFPVFLRMSQWKLHDFKASIAATPADLEAILEPLVDAGVDVFHCSTRHFASPEFEGSDLNLAGWVKKISGRPTITVGSVGLSKDLAVEGLEQVEAMLDRDEIDLVAVGRSLLADPNWARKMKAGVRSEIRPFDRSLLATLF